ncbi:MAG TPA: hypothetical protein VFM70_12800 [Salinimicrobium sp.]|nr:hypothetical protein [Salinimicrobium sp.]
MKIINLNGNAVVLADIKSISISGYFNVEPQTNQVKIELKTRREYIYNPNTEDWELETFNDILLVNYPNGQTADDNYWEMMQIWEDAMEEME